MNKQNPVVSPVEIYTPGMHILCDARSTEHALLLTYPKLRAFWEECVQRLGLQAIGGVWHNFPGGGFTGVICLTESHMSIHTWPEHGHFTFDVFLSNYRQVNDGKAQELYLSTLSFFNAESIQLKQVKR